MSGVPHIDDDGARMATGLVEEVSKIFDGQDYAVVLGALTTLVTIALDDSGVPFDVFVKALRGSRAKLASLRNGAKP